MTDETITPEDKPPEEKPPEGEGQEDDEPEEDGSQLIADANEAAERMENANTKMSKLLARQERIGVEKALGGEANAGEGKKEETAKEYKDRVMRGEIESPS